MRIKDFSAQVKADGDGLNDGEFEAIVSVFGNVDSYGDIVMPGAFTDTLAKWAETGDPIPVIWSHSWGDPFAHIGHVLEAKEIDRGLWVKGALDLDNPTAVQVKKLLVARRIKQFSFAYDVADGGSVTRDGQDVYELRKLDLYEVGPCLLGANQETELLAAKAAAVATGVTAGRTLPGSALADLKSARAAIDAIIAAATKTPGTPVPGQTDEQSQAVGVAPDEEPPAGAKSEQAAPAAPRRALAVATITTLKGALQ